MAGSLHGHVISGRLVLSHSAVFTCVYASRDGRVMAQSTTTRRGGQRTGGGWRSTRHRGVTGEARRCPPWSERRGRSPHNKLAKAAAQPSPHTPAPAPQPGADRRDSSQRLVALRERPHASASAEESEKCARVSTDQPAPVSKAGWPLSVAESSSESPPWWTRPLWSRVALVRGAKARLAWGEAPGVQN